MKFFLPSNKNHKYIKNFFKSLKLNDLIRLSEKKKLTSPLRENEKRPEIIVTD